MDSRWLFERRDGLNVRRALLNKKLRDIITKFLALRQALTSARHSVGHASQPNNMYPEHLTILHS